MTLRIDSKKWILYRHTRDFDKLCVVAEFLKSYTKNRHFNRRENAIKFKVA